MNEEPHSVCSFARWLRFEPYGIDHLVDAFGHHRLPLDPEFPFAIKAFLYESFPPGERLTWHNRLELFCPVSGSGSFQMGERIIDFKSGDLLVVDNLKLHGALSFEGPRSQAAVIYFRAELFYNLGSAVCDYAYLTPFYGLSETISPVLRAADPSSPAVHEALGYVRRREQARRLGALVEYLNNNYAEKIAVPQAAAMVGMSQSTFNRFFKQAAGMTFVDYLTHLRVTKARQMLRDQSLSIAEISNLVGFTDQSYFDKRFKEYFGKSPRECREMTKSS
jgi:AraC-like DNA-binding protein